MKPNFNGPYDPINTIILLDKYIKLAESTDERINNAVKNHKHPEYVTKEDLEEIDLSEYAQIIEVQELVNTHKHVIADITDYSESQADYNQNDENAADYIKNRTHYVASEEEMIEFANDWVAFESAWHDDAVCTFYDVANDTYYKDIPMEHEQDESGLYLYTWKFGEYKVTYEMVMHFINVTPENADLRVIKYTDIVHPLDEKFIPDSIARTSEIPQADWNITDENEAGFIKNKPEILQADYDQNDETAADYIKNRPFYQIDNVVSTLGTYSDESKTSGSMTAVANGYDSNATYTVVINGTRYEGLTFRYVQHSYSSAHAYVLGNKPNSNYPFGNISEDEFCVLSVGYSESAPVTLPNKVLQWSVGDLFGAVESIYIIDEVNADANAVVLGKMLDEKFIPDSIARLSDIPTNVSALTNDAGYAKTSDLPDDIASLSDIPDNSNIVNGSAWGSLRSSHARKEDQAYSLGNGAIAFGVTAKASGYCSHAEGSATTASGEYSHAEGSQTTASGKYSHAEGSQTTASGEYSHAEGSQTTASGEYSHAGGQYNEPNKAFQFMQGNGYNVGRSNAHTRDHRGNGWYASAVYVGGTPVGDDTDPSFSESGVTGATVDYSSCQKLATENYVDDAIANVDIPTDDYINNLIDAKLGVIENGSY